MSEIILLWNFYIKEVRIVKSINGKECINGRCALNLIKNFRKRDSHYASRWG